MAERDTVSRMIKNETCKEIHGRKLGLEEKNGKFEAIEESTEEENSQSDYEYSLREENIRLKSRLEQAKEKALLLEKNIIQYKEELHKEKEYAEKTRKTIFTLMGEKQSLQDDLIRQPSNGHHKGVEEVVRKLEHEVYLLEERLEKQRKRHHHEHLVMYDDLKDERKKQQEWKQTYLRSQVSVMAFRRKLQLMKDKIPNDDHLELMKCLEVGLNDYQDYINDNKKDEGVHKNEITHHTHHDDKQHSPHSNSRYNADHSSSDQCTSSRDIGYVRSPQTSLTEGGKNDTLNGPSPSSSSSSAHIYPTHKKHSPSRQTTESPDIDSNQPEVFIINEENKIHAPKQVSGAHSPGHVDGTYSVYRHLANSNSSRQRRDFIYSSTSDRTPNYKHWHHYSVDNPGHSRAGNVHISNHNEDSDVKNGHTSTSSSSYRHGRNDELRYHPHRKFTDHTKDLLELNANDTQFLELKFDHGFLKPSDSRSSSHKISAENSGKSMLPAGTPLEHKKIWCLTCDGEVSKKPCGHNNLVVQEREKEFPCPTCHRIFNNRSHLKRHNMIHSGEKPWACTYCEKRFNRKSHLNRHLLTHTGERPFKCPYCGKGFADNSDLKRHKQIHESTPGFIPIRPKETSSTATPILLSTTPAVITENMPVYSTGKPEFLSAVRSGGSFVELGENSFVKTGENSFVKTGENSFVKKKSEHRFPCNKCGKVFTRKSHLTRHKLTHDQVKIYCDCGRMFRQKAHLQAHLPACKRKRDAVEAKYLAAEHNSMLKHKPLIKQENHSPPPQASYVHSDELTENPEATDNNNVTMHVKQNISETSTSNNDNEQNGLSEKKEMDLSFNFNTLPTGIPALIRDPA